MVCNPTWLVGQLGPVPTFAQRQVAHMMSHCFLLLIYYWRWIGWGDPTPEDTTWKGLIIIIGKQKNLWVKHLLPVNPLEKPTQVLLLQINTSFNHILNLIP
jgi:hypothetical protein